MGSERLPWGVRLRRRIGQRGEVLESGPLLTGAACSSTVRIYMYAKKSDKQPADTAAWFSAEAFCEPVAIVVVVAQLQGALSLFPFSFFFECPR